MNRTIGRTQLARWGIATIATLGALWSSSQALQSARTADAREGRRHEVCIATRDLMLGTTPSVEDCRLVPMRANSIPPRALRAPDRLTTTVIRESVLAGNVITEAHLLAAQRTGDDQVPGPGLRIVTVPTSDGFAPTVGAIVDVYAAFSADIGGRDASVALVAARVRVVAAITDGATRAVRVLVSPDQARRIALARETAALSVAVVAPDDPSGRTG